jgi:hypothetical protein
MGNCFGIGLELNPDPISHRNAIFHIEKTFCIASLPIEPSNVWVSSQFLFRNSKRSDAAV